MSNDGEVAKAPEIAPCWCGEVIDADHRRLPPANLMMTHPTGEILMVEVAHSRYALSEVKRRWGAERDIWRAGFKAGSQAADGMTLAVAEVDKSIETANDNLVGARGDGNITVGLPPTSAMSRDRALRLAAWLVALADPTGERFAAVLRAVLHSGDERP